MILQQRWCLGKVINQSSSLFSRGYLEYLDKLDDDFKRDTQERKLYLFQELLCKD